MLGIAETIDVDKVFEPSHGRPVASSLAARLTGPEEATR